MNYFFCTRVNFNVARFKNTLISHICKGNNVKEQHCKKLFFSTRNNGHNNDNNSIDALNYKFSKKRKDEEETNIFSNPNYKVINSQPKRNLSVFGYNRGKLFVSIKKDFTSFVVNSLIIFVFLYSLYTLAPNETVSQRRKRIITERLMKEYDISASDLEMIEQLDQVSEE
ncbi:conserved Plasmodium protein, unknown function [Plasmodium knowlesi strain H]|uniref:Transmembrane protein n=3 Tax=Plasmodium knowlesi TaxID=5850 RepID=A0A5K1UIC9_PLAKH|nr:conserved protein, unknown function [Plasmodium knowlesi strain H]OTN67342.1 Uncharacterized protein PKNOH_S06402200 [Plasmodium knowlesi]CAA9987297.1 conserved protein, unknown function [Plasmodium knowlesi strain H]SBO23428.1 conserved Plasmodium protein, unknown function [Plasmodium knowlesi strain H]SBO24722.1 conserved Plasmodium protein, unknown function [Plasmodium knowlesi strain H]VVS76771.1 conserved protein, unknown function [Plasmodium knowlesi strain H]|eukprot:XP_002258301.1 hypothetical protein, conserved in Plasmodium species [Plasmodium knowlesi strain H]